MTTKYKFLTFLLLIIHISHGRLLGSLIEINSLYGFGWACDSDHVGPVNVDIYMSEGSADGFSFLPNVTLVANAGPLSIPDCIGDHHMFHFPTQIQGFFSVNIIIHNKNEFNGPVISKSSGGLSKRNVEQCQWNPWSSWGQCSKPCGSGVQNRTRSMPCSPYAGSLNVRQCNIDECVNCQWTQWSDWGACNESCGVGTKTRVRTPLPNTGSPCVGPSQEVTYCITRPCPRVCSWGSWGLWSNCNATCGTSYRTRTRAKNWRTSEPEEFLNSDRDCTGRNEETQACTTLECENDDDYIPYYNHPNTTQRFSTRPGSILITNITIYSNTENRWLSGYDILVINGLIVKIEKDINLDLFNGSFFDGKGRYVTPGIVNIIQNNKRHTQRSIDDFDVNNARKMVVTGVTTAVILPSPGNAFSEGTIIKLKVNSSLNDMLIPNTPIITQFSCPSSVGDLGLQLRNSLFDASVYKSLDCNNFQPSDVLALESLLRLLNGTSVPVVSCSVASDVDVILRTLREFNISVSLFYGVSEINDLSIYQNSSVASVADNWYQGSYIPKLLIDNGLDVLLYASDLLGGPIFEAVKSISNGLNLSQAFNSITNVPAKSLWLQERIGSIEKGKDGDIVVWDRQPTLLGAKPALVTIEGQIIYQSNSTVPDHISNSIPNPVCSNVDAPYSIEGLTVYTNKNNDPITNATIVVNSEGNIVCINKNCSSFISSGTTRISVNGGVGIPGFIHVGKYESGVSNNFGNTTEELIASYLLGANVDAQFGQNMLSEYSQNGVSVAVLSPYGNRLVGGQSAVFVQGDSEANRKMVSLDVYPDDNNLGILERILVTASREQNQNQSELYNSLMEPFVALVSGRTKLVAHTTKLEQIRSLLRLKSNIDFDLIVVGTEGVDSLSAELVSQNVTVILHPEESQVAQTLQRAGVKVGIILNSDQIRNLRLTAGLVKEKNNLDFITTLKLFTSNLSDIFNLGDYGYITNGSKAFFTVWNGEPFSPSSKIIFSSQGRFLSCTN